MTTGEMFRFTLFVTAVAAVYVFTPAILLRWLRSRGKEHFFNRAVDVIVVVAAIVGVGCVVEALREPYQLDVTHVTVPIEKMSPGAHIRIVHISDLHSSGRPRLEEKLPAIIAAERPDAIMFTGDALNETQGRPVFQKLMNRLTGIAPVFAVRGNWDDAGIYAGTAVRELKGDAEELDVRGQEVIVVGKRRYGMAVRHELASPPPDAVSVVLIHTPDAVYAAPNAAVVLAGHTHGGQIRLPWYGALVTLSRYGKRFEAGLYRVNNTWLYVNRGIGTELNAPVRFLCKPEVTVIDLVGPERSH